MRHQMSGLLTIFIITLAFIGQTSKSKEEFLDQRRQPLFACAINCIDGRVQNTVQDYLKKQYGVDYIDMVTEPGPNLILAQNKNHVIVENIKERARISVCKHHAKLLAIAGHHGCSGNPANKEYQINHLREAKKIISLSGLDIEIILLWVDEKWHAEKID